MTGEIFEKLNTTKTKLDEQRVRMRNEIVTVAEEWRAKGRKLRHDLDRQRDLTVGRLRDEGLEKICVVSERALRTAANLVERLEQLAPEKVQVLDGRAEFIRTQAQRVVTYADELHRPAIEGYDTMNITAVKDILPTLSAYQLEKLRAYEAEHKNRVTVLREIALQLDENPN